MLHGSVGFIPQSQNASQCQSQTFRRVAVKYLDARMKSIFSLRVKHLVNLFKKVCQTVPVILQSQDKLEMCCADC